MFLQELISHYGSLIGAEIKFLNLNLIFQTPTSCKLLYADAELLILGHSDLAFLEAIVFLSD